MTLRFCVFCYFFGYVGSLWLLAFLIVASGGYSLLRVWASHCGVFSLVSEHKPQERVSFSSCRTWLSSFSLRAPAQAQ